MMENRSAWSFRDEQAEADTLRLTGLALLLSRVACLAGFAVVLLIFVFSIPTYIAYLQHIVPGAADIYSGQLDTAGLQRLHAAGLSLNGYIAFQTSLKVLFVSVWLLVGALIFWRRSDDPFALFVVFTFATFAISFSYWAQAALPSWSGLLVGLNVLSGVCISFLLPLFPDGRFVPRWSAWFFLSGTLYHQGLAAFFPAALSTSLLLSTLDDILFTGGLLFLAAVQVYRYRRVSTPTQKQQTKWAVFGFVVAMTGFAAAISLGTGAAGPLLPGTPLFLFQQALVFVSLLFIPLSISVAILRSHLWDIDIIVNRALVYGLLTACIVGLYVFMVGYLGTLFHSELNLLSSLVAAGLVAVIFEPLRMALQRGVNRLFFGLRDEPYVVLASLSQTLKASLDPEAVLPTIVGSVRQALKLSYAAIELDLGEGPVLAAVSGETGTGQPLRMPLVYQGQPTGALLVASRGKGDELRPADLRLLENLSGQISVAVHAVRLSMDLRHMAADLQRSRETLVVAREEERRRLRRDLHDGIGPTLASLAQRMDAAGRMVKSDPDAAVAMLETLRGQVKTTIADIRRLVYALRPPVLDELGLVLAIQQQALPLQEGSGLRITVEAPAQMPELPAAVEVAAYRITLEALTNVKRHAQAQNCLVSLALAGGDALSLTVRDDGRGLPDSYRTGVGISSMRERVAELGGTFNLTSRMGEGTCIQVRLPVTGPYSPDV